MKNWKVTLASGLIGTSALFAAYRGAGPLTINGNTVQTNFMSVNGKTYVPIADVAKALKMQVSKADGGYELKPEGGANQLEGLNGKVGDKLSCGMFTLKVTEVMETDKYEHAYTSGSDEAGDKERLVIVKFQIKNASKAKMTLDAAGGENTALTDQNSHSYRNNNLDGRRDPELLPGAAADFAIVYRVPKTETVGDIVYVIHSYNVNTGYKDFTFRISPK